MQAPPKSRTRTSPAPRTFLPRQNPSSLPRDNHHPVFYAVYTIVVLPGLGLYVSETMQYVYGFFHSVSCLDNQPPRCMWLQFFHFCFCIIFYHRQMPPFIHFPFDEHLGCFRLGAVMNNATTNFLYVYPGLGVELLNCRVYTFTLFPGFLW